MDFVIPDQFEWALQQIPTPWGTLIGVRTDRITQTILADGQYEWAETAIVGQLLRAGSVAIDVGANIGYYTSLFHLLAGSRGLVHSFEANPFTAALLKMALQQNNWNAVRINNVAVGNKPGRMSVKAMNLAEAMADDSLNLGGWMLRESEEGDWDIEVTTLDKYVKDNKIEKVHFLKVDVEGFELKVIQGADTLIRKFKPYLLLEMRADNQADRVRCEQMIEFLRERDFACCRIIKRPFPHFRDLGQSDFAEARYYFNMLAVPGARYREYEASLNLRA
jgi:FkbM family methyltransferase